MSYQSEEQTQQQNPSAELYHFVYKGQNYRYTSRDEDVEYDGDTYTAITIERDGFQLGEHFSVSEVDIRAQYAGLFAALFTGDYPPVRLSVTITKFFIGDESTAVQLFDGYCVGASLKNHVCVMRFSHITGLLKREVPRFRAQSLCNNTLYDDACGLAKASYKTTATVTEVWRSVWNCYALHSVTFAAKAVNYYQNGMVQYGAFEWRHISCSTGNYIHLHYPFGITGSVSVDAYAGCNKSWTDCDTKFSNLDNFQGMPNMSDPLRHYSSRASRYVPGMGWV